MDALEGVTVIDLSRYMAGPYATVTLGDFGAEIIKIESVPDGDPTRQIGVSAAGGESGLFLHCNRNKRSLALDLRSADGLEVVHRLVGRADVLIENYRPGVADSIGLGYEALSNLNPRLVYCSVSGYGSTGPLAHHPATDPVVQAMSGVMSLTGDEGGPPVLVGVPIADVSGAMTLVQAVLLGLLARERTGTGQKIEVPMLAALVNSLTTRLVSYWADGRDPGRHGSAHSVVVPYQLYHANDGEFVAGVTGPDSWPKFCDAIGRPDLVDDSSFRTNGDRLTNKDALDQILYPIFAQRSRRDWAARFAAAGALYSDVNNIADILSHPQTRHLDLVQHVEHPTAGAVPQIGPVIKMAATPGRIRTAPPLLGEHSLDLLRELDYPPDAVRHLVERGVVHVPRDAAVEASPKGLS